MLASTQPETFPTFYVVLIKLQNFHILYRMAVAGWLRCGRRAAPCQDIYNILNISSSLLSLIQNAVKTQQLKLTRGYIFHQNRVNGIQQFSIAQLSSSKWTTACRIMRMRRWSFLTMPSQRKAFAQLILRHTLGI